MTTLILTWLATHETIRDLALRMALSFCYGA